MTTTISTGLPAPALPRPYSLLEHQRAARRHETSRRRLKLPGCFCSRSESLPTQPAGRTGGARRMRELMAAADRQVCTYTYAPVRYVSNACRRGARGAMATKTWAARYGVAGSHCSVQSIKCPVFASMNSQSVHGTGGAGSNGLELPQVPPGKLYPYAS